MGIVSWLIKGTLKSFFLKAMPGLFKRRNLIFAGVNLLRAFFKESPEETVKEQKEVKKEAKEEVKKEQGKSEEKINYQKVVLSFIASSLLLVTVFCAGRLSATWGQEEEIVEEEPVEEPAAVEEKILPEPKDIFRFYVYDHNPPYSEDGKFRGWFEGPSINYDWGLGGPLNNAVVDLFVILGEGTFYVKKDSCYCFQTLSDEGIRLFIDDELVIDKYVLQPATIHQAIVFLTKGYHELEIHYYDELGKALMKIIWEEVNCEKKGVGN